MNLAKEFILLKQKVDKLYCQLIDKNTDEQDPTVPTHVKNIKQEDIDNWNTINEEEVQITENTGFAQIGDNQKIFNSSVANTISTQGNEINALKEINFDMDIPNQKLILRNGNSVIITEISVAFLNDEAKHLEYDDNGNLVLKNEQGTILSSLSVASFISQVGTALQLDGYELALLDKDNNYLSTVTFEVSNILGLETVLEVFEERLFNLEGINYEWSPTNRKLTLYDRLGTVLSEVSLLSLDNEGTNFRYNATTLSLELYNADNELLDSIPVSSFIGSVGTQLQLNSNTLQLKDSQGNVLSTVSFTVSNINGLQTALDNINIEINKLKSKNYVLLSNVDYSNASIPNTTPTGNLQTIVVDWKMLASSLEIGKTYTITMRFAVISTYNSGARLIVSINNSQNIFDYTVPNTNWVQITQTFVANVSNLNLNLNGYNIRGLLFDWIKIEEGTTFTKWTPAPEDYINSSGEVQTIYGYKTFIDRIGLSPNTSPSVKNTIRNNGSSLFYTNNNNVEQPIVSYNAPSNYAIPTWDVAGNLKNSIMSDVAGGYINIGTGGWQPCAILQVGSTNKGIRIPVMTYNQMLSIVSPSQGLLVFVKDSESGIYEYDGTHYRNISKVDISSISNKNEKIITQIEYNSLSYKDPSITYIII